MHSYRLDTAGGGERHRFFDIANIFQSIEVMGMPDRYVQQLDLGFVGLRDVRMPLRTPQVLKEAADYRELAMWYL
jgi:hypothetical protein